MRFAHPAALWLAPLLAAPVVILHLLRPRRPPVEVSSTYLWRSVDHTVSAAAPWQRLRPTPLFVLQLLAVLLLATALARPVRETGVELARHTVFIIDTSGSMAATDGDPDRLADAKARARELRAQLPAGGLASIVVAGPQPRVVLTQSGDRQAFSEALGPVRTTAGPADFATAFNLAESLETPGARVGFVLLSDGGLTDAEKEQLPPGTYYVRTGDRSTNRAVTRVTVEPRGSGQHVRVTLRNEGGPASTQTLRIDVDGRTEHTERVRLPAGATVERDVDVPGGDRVEAALEGEDLLAADDRAFAVAGRRRPLRVLLAGPDNVFLDRLLASVPGVTVERSPTTRAAAGFDLAIYDQVAVPPDPGAPFLAIAPPGGVPGITVEGTAETPAVTLVRADHPLLAGLDLSDIGIAAAQRVDAPGDEVLVAAEAGPLLVRGTRHGRPFAYLAFPLGDSNLPLQVAYPILGDRLLTDLAGAAVAPGDLRVGDALPVAGAATVGRPGGTNVVVGPGAAAPVADRPGFWTIREEGRPERLVAVNADPAESKLAPADRLPVPLPPAADGRPGQPGEVPLLRWVVLALLLLLAAEVVLARRSAGVPRRQWRAAVALRAAVAGLLIAAAIGVTLPRTGRQVAVLFLIDGSDSLGADGRAVAVDWVRDALDRQPAGARAGVAVFGGDARLELTMQERAQLVQPAVQVDASRTDVAGALRLGGAVLPADARRRIVLVSDGRATEGDAAAEAQRLREAGIDVDVHVIERVQGPDVAVARLDAPARTRQGEAFPVRATLVAGTAQTARLTLRRDGEVVEERTVELAAGENVVEFAQTAGEPGLARYQLEVSSAADAVRENDIGYTSVQVEGPARVLVAEGMPGNGDTLAQALRSGGLQIDVIAADALPAADQLATWTTTVLVDVDARSLSPDQVTALSTVVRDQGRGLVVLGGDRSYALGGYLGSELEKLLPVVSEIKDPKRRESVAQVLAIDSSGSMGACHCNEGANGMVGGGNGMGPEGGVNKTDISRAAAARTIEALHENDQVGVLAFNTEQRWIIPLQQLPSEDVVQQGLRGLHPDGGTEITQPLREAGEALLAAKAKLKHIILFTDGFTAEGALGGLADQAADLAAQGITVSVLATGEGAANQLRAVAEAGQGRFYPGRDLSEVPQIMMEEAVIASRTFVNEGEFFPRVVSGAAPVRSLTSAPPLLGFLGVTAKPTAETHLQIGEDNDPLLASWRVGLGRVTAWTSDAADRWSQQWARWDGYPAFWADVVKDTFPLGGASGAAVRAQVVGDRLRITVEAETAWPDGAEAVARVGPPDREALEVPLERTSGTTFAGEVPAPSAGTYAVGAAVKSQGGALATLTATATRSYSAEYRPGPAEPDTLVRISNLSGGRGTISPGQAFDRVGLADGRTRIDLSGRLLLAALLLWPVAVALSRLALNGAGAAAARAAPGRLSGWVGRRRPRLPARPGRPARPGARPLEHPEVSPPVEPRTEVPEVETPVTVGRLLERKREGRR